MLRKVTHCAGHVSANTRPHQLRWGDREMGTAILCTKCSQVAGLAVFMHGIEDIDKFGVDPVWEGRACWNRLYTTTNQRRGGCLLARQEEGNLSVDSQSCFQVLSSSSLYPSFFPLFISSLFSWKEEMILGWRQQLCCHVQSKPDTRQKASTLEENENFNSSWNWSKGS